MNLSKAHLQKIIHERLLSNVVEGISHFPKPTHSVMDLAETVNSEHFFQTVHQCQLCKLAKHRKHAVVAKSLEKKKFFVLSDFPEAYEDESGELFSVKAPTSNLVRNLLGKLGILELSYFSYALKCRPERGVAGNALQVCAQNHLKTEIAKVSPEYVFCFGYRALQAFFLSIEAGNLDLNINENSKLSLIEKNGKSIQPYFFSSLHDLHANPHWRKPVWDLLSSL